MKKILSLWIFLAFSGTAWSQEIAIEKSEEPEEFRPQIRGALMMANSHVPKSFEGTKKVSIIPAWGFDVDYYFHPRWSVALQGDIKLQSFEVKDGETTLERSYPVALATAIHYHFKRHWSVYLGPGWELEKSENLFLGKIGTEYSFELSETFEIALNLAYENKQEVYNSWTFGIAFNKLLWRQD